MNEKWGVLYRFGAGRGAEMIAESAVEQRAQEQKVPYSFSSFSKSATIVQPLLNL
jgi:hypothetical protein